MCSWRPTGTRTVDLHFGHFTIWPTNREAALPVAPHPGHVEGTRKSFVLITPSAKAQLSTDHRAESASIRRSLCSRVASRESKTSLGIPVTLPSNSAGTDSIVALDKHRDFRLVPRAIVEKQGLAPLGVFPKSSSKTSYEFD